MAKRKTQAGPIISDQIINLLSAGCTLKDTCAYVGIAQETFYDWGRKYPEFSEATTRARVQARVGAVAVIRKSVQDGNAEDAKWFLERTDPANWGRKDVLLSLGIDPAMLKDLKRKADASGVDLAQVFEEMMNEFATLDRTDDSTE